MISRLVVILTSIGSAMAIGMAGLHASGYNYVRQTLLESNAPDFSKEILPPIFLYPSIVLCLLVALNITALVNNQAVSFILGASAFFFVANSLFGFILGGLIPGGVLLITSLLFGMASYLARNLKSK